MISKLILFLVSCFCLVHISHGQTFSDITVNDGEPLVVGMTSTQFSVTSSNPGGIHSISVYLDDAEVYKFSIVSKTVSVGNPASSSVRFEYIGPQDASAIANANTIVITVAIKDIVIGDNGVTTLQFRNVADSARTNNLVFNVANCQTISGTSVTSSALSGGGACIFGTYNCISTFTCDSGATLVDSTQAARTCGKQAKWELNGAEDTDICKASKDGGGGANGGLIGGVVTGVSVAIVMGVIIFMSVTKRGCFKKDKEHKEHTAGVPMATPSPQPNKVSPEPE